LRVPERTPEVLRRVHSLTGLLPLAVFLVEHLAVNGAALGGRARYAAASGWIARLPGLAWLEILGIALPLLVHMGLGVLVATELPAEGNTDATGWRTWSQRATGLYLMVYVLFHVWSTRLSPAALAGRADLFATMSREAAAPLGFALHTLGVLAAAWHLGNGLPRAAARWGFGARPAALRWSQRAGFALFGLLSLAGIASLGAFARAGAAR
jgi:succinate dehydrogenase / fumarate reductase cytochrome b subunit